jgi:hypothetical protein
MKSVAAAIAALLLAAPCTGRGDEPPVGATISCESLSLDRSLAEHMRNRHLLDTHGLAQVLLTLCPQSPSRFRWMIWDSLALEELDEPLRAEAALAMVVKDGPLPEKNVAATLLARTYLIRGDEQAYSAAMAQLTPESAARLRTFAARQDESAFQRRLQLLRDPQLQAAAMDQFQAYRQATHTRRPWLAGTLSTILPGAGQAYAGSWQGAAIAFVLNGVLIGATVELSMRHHYAAREQLAWLLPSFTWGTFSTPLTWPRAGTSAPPNRIAKP